MQSIGRTRPLFGLYSKRKVIREVEHYNLPTILAVGYCVRSYRGTQFHQWVTARLSEYLERKSMTTRQWIEKLDEQ